MRVVSIHAYVSAIVLSLLCLSVRANDSAAKTARSRMFVDDQHIAESSNVKRTLQQPQKLKKPLITGNGAWDSCPYMFGTVMYDRQEKIYKVWYMSYNYGQPLPVRTPFMYATSKDGRKWIRPNLGLFEYRGSKKNNIIMQNAGYHDSYTPSVVKDLKASDPGRRYKMIFWDFCGHDAYGGDSGMMIAFSPDGIRWHRHQEKPVLAAAKKEQSISDVLDLMIDPANGKFVAYTKGWAHPHPHHRQIVRTESIDFVNWSTPQVVLRHANTIKDTESYGMTVFAHEGMYFGLLRIYHSKTDKTIDIQLTSSRDGKKWNRVADQATFIPRGAEGAWDDGMIFTSRPVIRGDVMEFYYSGWDGDHASHSRRSGIGLATLPLDRFVAVEADGGKGLLRTTPQKIANSTLTINADARGGKIRVALLDKDGKRLPGFSLDDCDSIEGDSLRHRLSWRGNSDFGTLAGKKVSLLFEISGKAKLFALRN
ncbi:MAG: hypothetical protein JXM70_15680 [Pirellulales bacterium]|nr:hypothetical protein [Pirellulales bacterium]